VIPADAGDADDILLRAEECNEDEGDELVVNTGTDGSVLGCCGEEDGARLAVTGKSLLVLKGSGTAHVVRKNPSLKGIYRPRGRIEIFRQVDDDVGVDFVGDDEDVPVHGGVGVGAVGGKNRYR
jgi:hypothetical protein